MTELFTWLSLVMYLTVSFCAVPFPRGVLGEIWDLIESVSKGMKPTLTALLDLDFPYIKLMSATHPRCLIQFC